MTKLIIDNKTIYVSEFTCAQAAYRWAYDRCEKPQRVILGTPGKYWVARPVDAEKLARAGFEYAR